MDESESRSLAKWNISVPSRYSVDRIQYLLKTEEQILQFLLQLQFPLRGHPNPAM
jgi:hypothetical protein